MRLLARMRLLPTVVLTLYIGLVVLLLGLIGKVVVGMGLEFGLGTMFGIFIYQVAHRCRYGDWFG